MNYRLLNEGEVIQEGDEIFAPSHGWVPVQISIDAPANRAAIIRRPFASQWPDPIPMSERKPTRTRVLKFVDGVWGIYWWDNDNNATHWLPLPPAPVSPDDAACRFAFDALVGKTDRDWNEFERGFKAALDYARQSR